MNSLPGAVGRHTGLGAGRAAITAGPGRVGDPQLFDRHSKHPPAERTRPEPRPGCWYPVPWLTGAQAARRRTSQTVAAMSRTDSASSQPPSIHWKGQNRLPGW